MLNFIALIRILLIIGAFSFSSIDCHGFGELTPVKKGGNSWRIEQIYRNPLQEKLWVSSFDAASGIIVSRAVTAVGKSVSNCYIRISCNSNRHNDILCTPTQKLYVFTLQKFIPAHQLKVGDELFSAYQESVKIKSIELVKEPLTIYTLEVEQDHNFFVGYYGILAHNMLFPVLTCGLSAIGAGATAGSVVGGCLGPVPFVGAVALGGAIGIAIKFFSDNVRSNYLLHFDIDKVDRELKQGVTYNDNDAPAKEPIVSKTVDDLIAEAKPGNKTKGRTKQYKKEGGFAQAEKDFESLAPQNIKDIATGRRGTLLDGRDVNVRIESSAEKPTLEIYDRNRNVSIKIRYYGIEGKDA